MIVTAPKPARAEAGNRIRLTARCGGSFFVRVYNLRVYVFPAFHAASLNAPRGRRGRSPRDDKILGLCVLSEV
jgi:hypothetical protein